MSSGSEIMDDNKDLPHPNCPWQRYCMRDAVCPCDKKNYKICEYLKDAIDEYTKAVRRHLKEN